MSRVLSVNQRYILKANHNNIIAGIDVTIGVVSKSKIHFESKSQPRRIVRQLQYGVVSKSKIHFESKSQPSK